jgi:tetratricopeptide (TPR) repeat protein
LSPSTAGFWHRLDGVFAAWGARVSRGAERGQATVFDVEPTVSALLGLPVERRASGSVVRGAFPDLSAPARKDLTSVPVRRLAADQMSEKEATEYTKKLMALGYLSGGEPGKLAPSGGDRPGLTEGAWNNLGLFLSVNGGRADFAGAEAAYKKALELRPGYHSPQFNLAVLYRKRGDDRRALDWLFRSLVAGHADPQGTLLLWASEYQADGKSGPEREVLEQGARRYPDSEPLARQLALLRFRSRDCGAAERAVAKFAATSQSPDTLNVLGLLNTCLGRRDAAIAFFRRSLDVKPDQPGAIRSLDLLQKGLPPGQQQP